MTTVRKLNRLTLSNRVKLYNEVTTHLAKPDHTLFGTYSGAALYFSEVCQFTITPAHFKSLDDVPVHKLIDPNRGQSGGLGPLWLAIKDLQDRMKETEKIMDTFK